VQINRDFKYNPQSQQGDSVNIGPIDDATRTIAKSEVFKFLSFELRAV
jgi:hypothetical protein